jgi:hypothetical protein
MLAIQCAGLKVIAIAPHHLSVQASDVAIVPRAFSTFSLL